MNECAIAEGFGLDDEPAESVGLYSSSTSDSLNADVDVFGEEPDDAVAEVEACELHPLVVHALPTPMNARLQKKVKSLQQ